MRTIKELIELAEAGEAADFTTSIQEALTEHAEDAVQDMASWPDSDDIDDIDLDDDIDDLPEDEDLGLDDEELQERNALNHQRARAFRAGKKEFQAKDMSTSVYRSSRQSKADYDAEVAGRKKKKEHAVAASKLMHADATEKAVKLGGRSREMSHIRDAGKKYKETHGVFDKTDRGKAAQNADEKEAHGQGKYLHRHLSKQHDHIRRQIDDLRNDISNTIHRHSNVNDNKGKYGDTWSLSRFTDKTKGPSLTTDHLKNLKALHGKLKAIHHAASSLAEDVLDWDLIEEDFLDVAIEYDELLQELEEGKTFKANDDEDHRGHKRMSYMRRRDRKAKCAMEDVGTLSLADNLTDEELQEIVDTITEEHFEMLDELSQARLSDYMGKAVMSYDSARQVGGSGQAQARKIMDRRVKGVRTAAKKWTAKK